MLQYRPLLRSQNNANVNPSLEWSVSQLLYWGKLLQLTRKCQTRLYGLSEKNTLAYSFGASETRNKKFYNTDTCFKTVLKWKQLFKKILFLFAKFNSGSDQARSLYYKTFYGRNVRIYIISQRVCPWQVFPAQSNVFG